MAERLSDVNNSWRENDKKKHLEISSRWTQSLNSYSLCLDTLQGNSAASVDGVCHRSVPVSRALPMKIPLLCRSALAGLLLLYATTTVGADPSPQAPQSLELSRPIRSWEFLPIVGTRAALLGNEAGEMEAWVYPLKIFRGFHLTFHVGGLALPAESLAGTLIVRPESATIIYAGDNFSVRETLFAPVHEPGALILFDIETSQPLEIEAGLIADF